MSRVSFTKSELLQFGQNELSELADYPDCKQKEGQVENHVQGIEHGPGPAAAFGVPGLGRFHPGITEEVHESLRVRWLPLLLFRLLPHEPPT